MFWVDDQFMLGKQGFSETYAPVHFRRNSLVALGHVRRAQVKGAEAQAPGRVRVVATVGPVLNRLLNGYDCFHELVAGVWGLKHQTDSHIDIGEALPMEGNARVHPAW